MRANFVRTISGDYYLQVIKSQNDNLQVIKKREKYGVQVIELPKYYLHAIIAPCAKFYGSGSRNISSLPVVTGGSFAGAW